MRHHRLLLASVISAAVTLAAAACSKSDATPAASSSAACTFTLGSVTTAVAAVGATGTIAVTASAATCAWTAISSATFLTVSPASGTGNGSVSYTVTSNQGVPRSASITIGSNVVNFAQDSPQAPATCAISLAAATKAANSGGGDVSVDVAGVAACGWKATSNSSFLTIKSGASGSGPGTVVVTAAPNPGKARSGTVTIGGLTFTVTQDDGISASFQMTDPGQTIGAVNECRFRGATANNPTTCTLTSTSSTGGPRAIVSYEWNIQYTYGTAKQFTPISVFPSTSITDTCGLASSTDDGVGQPLSVVLKVTDSAGNTATASSGSGSQPALIVRLYTCGN